MDFKLNYEKNTNYFKEYSWGGLIKAGIAGVILLLVLPPIGILILLVVAGITAYRMIKKVSDQHIDDECSKILHTDIISKGLQRLGLDEEEVSLIEPVVFSGHYFDDVLYKKGDDGKYRTSKYQVSVFFFGEEQVYYYSNIVSIIKNQAKELTEEYFYSDIVSAATQSAENHEYFKLTTSGGTSIEASMEDNGSLKKAISGMKQLLRDKKKSVIGVAIDKE